MTKYTIFIKILLVSALIFRSSFATLDHTKTDDTGFKLFKTVLDIDRYTMNFTGYIGVSKLNTDQFQGENKVK